MDLDLLKRNNRAIDQVALKKFVRRLDKKCFLIAAIEYSVVWLKSITVF